MSAYMRACVRESMCVLTSCCSALVVSISSPNLSGDSGIPWSGQPVYWTCRTTMDSPVEERASVNVVVLWQCMRADVCV